MDKNLENLNTAIQKLHWFKRWFLPSKLLNALRVYKTHPGPTTQFQAYVAFENTWNFLKWIFSCLSNFRKTQEVRGYTLLKKFGLLSEENLRVLLNHRDMKGLLTHLSTFETLNQTSFDLMVNANPYKPFRITLRVSNDTPREEGASILSGRVPHAQQSFYPNSSHSTPDSAVVVTTPESAVLVSGSSVPPSASSAGTSGSDASGSDISNASGSDLEMDTQTRPYAAVRGSRR